MSKERLKEIKEKYDMWSDDFNLDPQDVEWLIEQTELGISQQEQFHDYQTQNLRLQERVRELEEFKKGAERLYKYAHISAKKSVEEKEKLIEQNKRYRKLLNKVAYEDINFKQTVNIVREYLEGEE